MEENRSLGDVFNLFENFIAGLKVLGITIISNIILMLAWIIIYFLGESLGFTLQIVLYIISMLILLPFGIYLQGLLARIFFKKPR